MLFALRRVWATVLFYDIKDLHQKGGRAAVRLDFTNHAYDRIWERVYLSPHDIQQLFDNQLVVPIGEEKKGNIRQYLFYSSMDRACFIAVVAADSGAVLTIKPDRTHFCVSDDARLLAQDLVESGGRPRVASYVPKVRIACIEIIAMFHIFTQQEERIFPYGLRGWKNASAPGKSLRDVRGDSQLHAHIRYHLLQQKTKDRLPLGRREIRGVVLKRGEERLFLQPDEIGISIAFE